MKLYLSIIFHTTKIIEKSILTHFKVLLAMAIRIKKLHNVILLVEHDDGRNMIYKLSDHEDSNEIIKKEYELIQHMGALDRDFVTFDNLHRQKIKDECVILPFYETNVLCPLSIINEKFYQYYDKNIMLMSGMYNSKLVTIYFIS